jgi:hypothetical protein
MRCWTRSAQKLDREADLNTIVNQGWASLWLAEGLQKTGDFENAYCFARRAKLRWERACPARLRLVNERLAALVESKAELAGLDALSDWDIDERCQAWLRLSGTS